MLRSGGQPRAPMPSVVVEVRVREGERVEVGQPVVVLDRTTAETVLRLPVCTRPRCDTRPVRMLDCSCVSCSLR